MSVRRTHSPAHSCADRGTSPHALHATLVEHAHSRASAKLPDGRVQSEKSANRVCKRLALLASSRSVSSCDYRLTGGGNGKASNTSRSGSVERTCSEPAAGGSRAARPAVVSRRRSINSESATPIVVTARIPPLITRKEAPGTHHHSDRSTQQRD